MVRATHGVHNGSYYFEVEVNEPKGVDAHVRLGWSTRQGSLQAPCGYDKWSYGYRDVAGKEGAILQYVIRYDPQLSHSGDANKSNCIGSKVHGGVRDDKYGSSFGAGDIIGCFLHLDDQNVRSMSCDDSLVLFSCTCVLRIMCTQPGNNQMRFFKNGVDQGIAYQGKQVESGIYFPAISLYKQAAVSVNFGPSFILR
jgi:Set1/Ash2 histone methyltransferase complex subunit ASH2